MKVEVREVKKEGINYPCLMIGSDGSIVLMKAPCEGVVLIEGGSGYEIGYEANNWSMDCFKPFNGEITLSND